MRLKIRSRAGEEWLPWTFPGEAFHGKTASSHHAEALGLCARLYKTPGAACSGVACSPGSSTHREGPGAVPKSESHAGLPVPASSLRTTWSEKSGLQHAAGMTQHGLPVSSGGSGRGCTQSLCGFWDGCLFSPLCIQARNPTSIPQQVSPKMQSVPGSAITCVGAPGQEADVHSSGG